MKRFETVLFLGVLVLAACGGSGGGGDDPVVDAGGGVPKTSVSATFTPNEPNPGPDTVSMDQASAVADTITVAVLITNTDNLHTAGFDVIFDDTAMDFLGHNEGSLLEQGGNAPTYSVASQTGRVVVGVSRSGSSETSAVGSQTLIELVFKVHTAGTHAVSLANADLLNSGVNILQGISWFGGNAVAN